MIRLFTTTPCALIAALVASVGLLAGCSSDSLNSCEAPYLSVDRTSVVAGSSFELRGTGFWNGCPDANGAGAEDLQNLAVVLSAKGAEVVLDHVDAKNGEFVAKVEVPQNYEAGMATITVGDLATAEVTIS